MIIGILVAVEFDAFYNIYKDPIERYKHGSFEVLKYHIHGKDVFVCPSSAGQIRASIAMTLLLDIYKCDTIINYGLVGALSDHKVGELTVVESVTYACGVMAKYAIHIFGVGSHISTVRAYLAECQGWIVRFCVSHVRHLTDSNGFLPRRGTSQRFP